MENHRFENVLENGRILSLWQLFATASHGNDAVAYCEVRRAEEKTGGMIVVAQDCANIRRQHARCRQRHGTLYRHASRPAMQETWLS